MSNPQIKILESGATVMSEEQTITVTYDQTALQSEKAQLQANIDNWIQRIADIDAKLATIDTEIQAGRVVDMRPVKVEPVEELPVDEKPVEEPIEPVKEVAIETIITK